MYVVKKIKVNFGFVTTTSCVSGFVMATCLFVSANISLFTVNTHH